MDLSQYINPLLKWWWLLLLSMGVAAVSSFLAVLNQPNTFQAHTTLMIGSFIQDPNPNSNEYYLAQQLASTYADIANRELIQGETQQALGLPFLPINLTKAIPNTSLIEISVTDTDPERAQLVANELSTQLIKHSPSGINPEDEGRQKFVADQLDTLQQQIKDTQSEIEKLQEQYAALTSARQISDVQSQINTLQQKQTSLQLNYASLLANTQKGATNTLTVIEPAGLPTTPTGPNRPIVVVLAAAIGLSLAGMAAYGMEAIDTSVKSADELTKLVKIPILGLIGNIPNTNNNEQSIYVLEEPRSPISDGFRLLRTNLEFLNLNNAFQIILVTSADVSDGKSAIAVNLAASIVQKKDKKVILIDGDLRRPSLHKALAVPNQNGLSDICLGNVPISEAIISGEYEDLKFIPAGTPPPSPVELLSSTIMLRTLEEIRTMADLIIIDSPPIYLADTVVLSGLVDGVIVVVDIGHTKKKTLLNLITQVEKTGAKIIGIVANRAPESESHYADHYHYKKD